MVSAGNKHTATITPKPNGSGSLNVPQEVLESLGGGDGDGAPVVFIVDDDDGVAHLVPLEDVLLGEH